MFYGPLFVYFFLFFLYPYSIIALSNLIRLFYLSISIFKRFLKYCYTVFSSMTRLIPLLLDCHCPRVLSTQWSVTRLLDCYFPRLLSAQWSVTRLLDCHCPRVLSAGLSLHEGIIHPVVCGLSLPEGIICLTVIARGYYLLDCHFPRVLSAQWSVTRLLDCH